MLPPAITGSSSPELPASLNDSAQEKQIHTCRGRLPCFVNSGRSLRPGRVVAQACRGGARLCTEQSPKLICHGHGSLPVPFSNEALSEQTESYQAFSSIISNCRLLCAFQRPLPCSSPPG